MTQIITTKRRYRYRVSNNVITQCFNFIMILMKYLNEVRYINETKKFENQKRQFYIDLFI